MHESNSAEFFSAITTRFANNCFNLIGIGPSVITTVTNHLSATVDGWEHESEIQYQKSQTRKLDYARFIKLKNELGNSIHRDDQYAYRYLCGIESATNSHNEQTLFNVAAAIANDPETIIKEISKEMKRLCKSQTLTFKKQRQLR
ncbi:MAG TPA: hypothetical protein VH413_11410 [Verrucomicrobiae bacterium]|jgi:hypothetical protein|nr:hypothetical protein [Verrucomicrobiae bacterium]